MPLKMENDIKQMVATAMPAAPYPFHENFHDKFAHFRLHVLDNFIYPNFKIQNCLCGIGIDIIFQETQKRNNSPTILSHKISMGQF